MPHRTVRRLLAVGFLTTAFLAVTAGPASAHADLLSTEPGYGSTLPQAPDRVLVRYDLPVEVKGAQVELKQAGKPRTVAKAVHASPDRRDVAIPLPDLKQGNYLLTWFLFGSDGDVMGGELAFTVSSPGSDPAAVAAPPAAAPQNSQLPPTTKAFAPLARAQDAARLIGLAAVTLLVGGVAFVAALWPAGSRLPRTRLLLWASAGAALVANAAALGLKGAAVSGQSALGAFTPSALTALQDTHVGRVLALRLALLVLAVPLVVSLTLAPQRALLSRRWVAGAATIGLGTIATHGMLSHAYARGFLASVVDAVHLSAVSVWLGGLAVLGVVVLPRRRADELCLLVPRWSRVAFRAVATAAVSGAALLVLISPAWSELSGSSYGQLLGVKGALIVFLLVAASHSRDFVQRRLPDLGLPSETELIQTPVAVMSGGAPPEVPSRPPRPSTVVDVLALRPFVSSVTAELCIAASILAATTFLVGRSPPT